MFNESPFIVNNALAVSGETEISGSTTITGSLEVSTHAKAVQVRIAGGTIAYIDSSMVSGLSGLSQVVDTFDASLGNSARWTISISGGYNYKTTEILSIWGNVPSQGGLQITSAEYTTNSIGDGDVPVTMTVNIVGGMVRLMASASTGSWNIKTLRFML